MKESEDVRDWFEEENKWLINKDYRSTQIGKKLTASITFSIPLLLPMILDHLKGVTHNTDLRNSPSKGKNKIKAASHIASSKKTKTSNVPTIEEQALQLEHYK